MDTEMPEDNSKPDSTSVAEDKDDFQEAISTLDSVDEEKIDAFTPTSAVERSKKKSALFDDSLEVEENATFEDEYDENNSVPGGSSQPSTKLNL
ncbi:hypothetical protein G6F38_009792 [Rhizopus arrhizus]|nr:hypothetical protein G6F38_009792 [Rhizopus arrhizus]